MRRRGGEAEVFPSLRRVQEVTEACGCGWGPLDTALNLDQGIRAKIEAFQRRVLVMVIL